MIDLGDGIGDPTHKECPHCGRVVPTEDNLCLTCMYNWPHSHEFLEKIRLKLDKEWQETLQSRGWHGKHQEEPVTP